MPKERPSLMLENKQILYRNFSGRAGMYNKEGDRDFSVILSPEEADSMAAAGWTIRMTKVREEGDEAIPFFTVKVNYSGWKDPKIVLMTSRARTRLDESDLITLDQCDIAYIDLIVNGNPWGPMADGKSGMSAYLQSAFVMIDEDPLEQKYAINDVGTPDHD